MPAGDKTSGITFGPYRLIRRLGAGGMAEVFLAKLQGPAGFEKSLVIKRILPHLLRSERLTELFLKEARLAALVDHPNLVHVSGFGQIEDQYYLAMEYVDGFTLAEFLTRVGTVSPGVACKVAVGLCEALNAIHTARDPQGQELGLVHRDVSARNIMLTRDGAVKLLDFGIAVSREDTSSSAMGTRKYMAPEQQAGATVDHRADLFGVGVVLYELLTGHTPAGGEPVRPAEIPDVLWRVVEGLLQPSPEQRPTSARKVQADLEVFVASRGVEGTGAHLAEMMSQLSVRRSPLRVLSRITQMTRLTRVTKHPELGTGRRSRAWMIGALLALVAVVSIVWGMSDGPDEETVIIATKVVEPAEALTTSSTAHFDERLATSPTVANALIALENPASPEPKPPSRRTRTRRKATARSGRLTLNTQPWTKVYLGRKLLGMTPIVEVKLPAGRHRLRLENTKLGVKKSLKVTIKAGKTTRIQRKY